MVQAELRSFGVSLEPSDGVTAHLVGRLTPAVLSFLLPAIRASFALGRRQALLYINDGVSDGQMTSIPVDVHRIDVLGVEFVIAALVFLDQRADVEAGGGRRLDWRI